MQTGRRRIMGAVLLLVAMGLAACGVSPRHDAASKQKNVSAAASSTQPTSAAATNQPASPSTTTGPVGLNRTQSELRSVFDSSTSHSISWRSAPVDGGNTPRLLGLEGTCSFEIIGPPNDVEQADDFCVVAGASNAQSKDESGVFLAVFEKFGNTNDEQWFAGRVKDSETSNGQLLTTDARKTDGAVQFEVQTSASVGTVEVIVTPSADAQASQGTPSATSAQPTSTSATTTEPGVLACAPTSMPTVIRPTIIYIGCAAGDVSFTDLTWQSWGTSSAIGTGTLNVNNCEPSCAQGQEETYQATVDLSDPGDVDGELVFQQLEGGPTGFSDGPAETGTQPGTDWGA
jgi:hypothetical protein